MKSKYANTPMLPSAPFRAWLEVYMRQRDLSIRELADRLSMDVERVRRVYSGRASTTGVVSEALVERWGIRLAADPRLAARLYPQLDYDSEAA